MKIEDTPGGVEADVLIVIDEELPTVTEGGLNDAEAPAGRPEADNVTVWGEPFVSAVETVAFAGLPGFTEPEGGLTAIEKSLAGGVTHPGSWNDAMRVRQLKVPSAGMYSVVYQKVQPSIGSTVIAE